MKPNLLCRIGIVSFSCLLPLRAGESDLRELLRDALYTEEVSRDPEKAAKQYEELLSRHDEQKAYAASALFRLAEVRRKQDRKDDAIALYQRLLTEFPNAAAETKLAKENLAALGGKMPEQGELVVAVNEEQKEIQRLETLLKTSPDLVRNGEDLTTAISKGWMGVAKWLVKEAEADPADLDLLKIAVENGNLEMVRWLLSIRGASSGGDLTVALMLAVEGGHLEVVRELLKAGADPKSSQDGGRTKLGGISFGCSRPLTAAISSAQFKVADVLLDAGADVNAVDGAGGATPLFAAAANPDPAAARCLKRLIELGAKTDVTAKVMDETYVPSSEVELNAIQAAVMNEAWDNAKILISHGADIKKAGLFDPFLDQKGVTKERNTEKVQFLIENGADPKQPRLLSQLIDRGPDAIPMIKLLLEAGCDPNELNTSPIVWALLSWNPRNVGDANRASAMHSKLVELIQLLLKHGADPNATFGEFTRGPTRIRQTTPSNSTSLRISPFVEESEESKRYPASLLMKVVEFEERQNTRDTSLIKILLDAGAKPTVEFPEVFDFVAQGTESLPIAVALLPFRPKTLNLERTGYFENWNPKVKRLFLDNLLNPAVRARGGVSLVLADVGGCYQLLAPGVTVPDSSRLLWENAEKLTDSCGGFPGKAYLPKLTRLRREGEDGWIRTVMDLMGSGELPDLRQGDFIELERGEVVSNDSDRFAGPGVVPQESSFAKLMQWHLRKRVSFPVMVEIDGKSREIKLRGDLLSYEPTKDEAPLLSAGRLARLFLPTNPESGQSGLKQDSILTVRRKGGTDVRMDLSASGALEFKLQAGDHLILPNPESVIDDEDRKLAWLKIPGISGSRAYQPDGVMINNNPTPTMPTLIQVLTDAYASNLSSPGDQPLETLYPELSSRVQNGIVPVILHHPDFSRIRIKRKGADGKETNQEIDLNKAIQRCSEETPAAETRKADVALLPGDVVELSLKTELLGKPWNGFTKEEERFFQKALSGVVMVKKSDGIIDQVRISYHQPEWKPSPHGLIPFPPKEGVPTTRLSALTGMNGAGLPLKRDGEVIQINSADLFMRDGDEISLGGGNTIQGRQPRPRVVPPPAPQPSN